MNSETNALLESLANRLNEAEEIEVLDLPPKTLKAIQNLHKKHALKPLTAFSGGLGNIVVLKDEELVALGSVKLHADALKDILAVPGFRWLSVDNDGTVSIGC